jgi:hypothetical protein
MVKEMSGLMKIKLPTAIQTIGASYIITKDVATGKYALYSPTGQKLYESTDRYDVIKYAFNNLPDNSLIDIVDTKPHRYLKPKYVSGGKSPLELTFRIKRINRFCYKYDDPDLSIPVLESRFMFSYESQALTKLDISGSTSISISNGVATIAGGSSGSNEGYYLYNIDTVPFALVLVLEVESFTSGQANPQVVVVKDSNNRLQWLYNAVAGYFNSWRVVNGTTYPEEVKLNISMTPPFRLIMVLIRRTALFLVEKDNRVYYAGQITDIGFSFENLSVWRTFKIGFGAYINGTNTVSVRRFKVAYAVMSGLRDPTLVVDKYGAPLIVDGKAYFTATIATIPNLSYEFHNSAYGLFSIDADGNVKLVKIIVTRRPDKDNYVYGDHAGEVLYDPDTGYFYFIISAWDSESPVKLLLGKKYMDINSRGVEIVDATPITDITEGYDPYVFYDLDAKKWRLSYVYRGTHLYVLENTDLATSGWTQIASASVPLITEGIKLFKINGTWYYGTATSATSPYMELRRYPTLEKIGMLNVPALWKGGVTVEGPPHPSIIPFKIGESTKYVLVTMAMTVPRSELVIMEADEINDGYEYPLLITQ